MLDTFSRVDDVHSGSWGDAYDDAFLAHVWHQYTLYPVTPLVTGFVIRIASLRLSTAVEPAKQLALGLRLVAESTSMFRGHAESAKRELGEACAKGFTAHRNYVRTWLGTALEEDARVIERWLPTVGIAAH